MNKVTPEQKKAMREQLLKEARKERRYKNEYERFWNDSSRTCEKMGYRLEECMMIGPKTLKEHLSENLGIDWMELGIEDKRNLGTYFWQQAREGKNGKDANLYPVPITFLTPDGKGNVIPEEESYNRGGTDNITYWQKIQGVELSFFEKILQFFGLYCTTGLEYNKMLSDSREAARKKAEAMEVKHAIDDKYKMWEQAFFKYGGVPKTVTLPNGKKLNPVAGCMAILAKEYPSDFEKNLYTDSPRLGNIGIDVGDSFKKDIKKNPEKILTDIKGIDNFTVKEPEDLKKSGFALWTKMHLVSAVGQKITKAEKRAGKMLNDIYHELEPYNAVNIDKSNNMDTEKNKQNEEPEKEEEMTIG